MKKAFTIIELVVAVAILAMMLAFASVIFSVSIDAYRVSSANAEVMRKMRAITDQLNRGFKGLRKDGYLVLYADRQLNRYEFADSLDSDAFQTDRIYYFSTGDFQSWFPPYPRSNIARIYLGHDSISLTDDLIPVSQWRLARDVVLLTVGYSSPDCNDCDDVSFAVCKADLSALEDANSLLNSSVSTDIQQDLNNVRRLLCQNLGEIIIEWTDGTKDAVDNSLVWDGTDGAWTPLTLTSNWPKALKFTFTLYDSKGILEAGRRFTHIVYIGD